MTAKTPRKMQEMKTKVRGGMIERLAEWQEAATRTRNLPMPASFCCADFLAP
jgi:hypothetical protein